MNNKQVMPLFEYFAFQMQFQIHTQPAPTQKKNEIVLV